MMKAGVTIFLLSIALLMQASEKLFLLAEDGFNAFLKQDFHKLALALSRKYECKLSSVPEKGVQPVLKISTVKESGNYESVLFAVKGNLFIVNEKNPVDGLTSADLKQIFGGTFRKWKRTSVPLRQICLSGDRKLIPSKLAKGSVPWVFCPKANLVFTMISEDMTALGIISLANANLSAKETRILPVDGVAATPETVFSGTYPASVKYYLSIRKDAPAEVREIYKKLRSKQTKIKLLKAGILPAVEGD